MIVICVTHQRTIRMREQVRSEWIMGPVAEFFAAALSDVFDQAVRSFTMMLMQFATTDRTPSSRLASEP